MFACARASVEPHSDAYWKNPLPGSVEFGRSKGYWASMGKSAAWITGYSLQFEFGPISEASIGNVGMTPDRRGWVDHVVTPVVGFGLIET